MSLTAVSRTVPKAFSCSLSESEKIEEMLPIFMSLKLKRLRRSWLGNRAVGGGWAWLGQRALLGQRAMLLGHGTLLL